MDTPQMIPLDDVVLRDDLDPRLGQRDVNLIQQYAEIFDELPPIEINQDNELVDGWHRVRAAERAERSEIAYVVVETDSDDDLGDKMWAANLKHGVQYTRVQRQTQGLKLYQRKLSTGQIANRVGVSAATVRRWTIALREEDRRMRDERILELAEAGTSLRQIADEVGVDHKTVAATLGKNAQMRETPHEEVASETSETIEFESDAAPEDAASDIPDDEPDEKPESSSEESLEEPLFEAEMNDVPVVTDPASYEREAELALPSDETPELEAELPPPAPIPDEIVETARAVMVGFVESRPDAYVARLEVSANEWMTITDDSLSNELERKLLTSATAMCLWQEWMVWYQGRRTKAFTDAFGKIGPVFVRGRSGQWTIASRLRSILKRLWE